MFTLILAALSVEDSRVSLLRAVSLRGNIPRCRALNREHNWGTIIPMKDCSSKEE